MRNPEFPNQVRREFDFLFVHYGFTTKEDSYTDFPLSEWLIKLCSTEICIRVSIDKAQVFVDVGLPKKNINWFDLMYLMMYATQDMSRWRYMQLSGEINEEFYRRQLSFLSNILKDNFVQIKKTVVGIEENKSEKRKFERFLKKSSP